MLLDKCEDEKFIRLCNILENILIKKTQKSKINILESYINNTFNSTCNLYPLLRLTIPDNDRLNYNIKEKTLAKIITKVHTLPYNEGDRLINYKDVSKQLMKNCTAGDFSSVLYSVLEDRLLNNKDNNITIGDINNILDKLYISQNDNINNIFIDIAKKCNALEHKWLSKIIIKGTMKIGVGEKVILNRLHPKAIEWYNNSTSLKYVMDNINNEQEQGRIQEEEEEAVNNYLDNPVLNNIMFLGIRPQRAIIWSKKVMENYWKKIKKDKLINDNMLLYSEVKYDGERLIVHIDKNIPKIIMYSRNGNIINDNNNNLSNLLLSSFKGKMGILDGELLTYDNINNIFLKHTYNRSIVSSSSLNNGGNNDKCHLCYIIFDILLYGDDNNKVENYINTPLNIRKDVLSKVIKEYNTYIEISEYKTIGINNNINDEIMNELNMSINNGEEGRVFKDPNSLYNIGKKGYGWFKLKGEYSNNNNTAIDLDLVIVGGYYGKNNNSGNRLYDGVVDNNNNDILTTGLSSFLLAAPISNESNNNNNNKLIPIAKVSVSQLTLLNELKGKLKGNVIPWSPLVSKYAEDNWLMSGSGGGCSGSVFNNNDNIRPDVILRDPRINSIIMVIRCSEIIKSNKWWNGGITLRFPRCHNNKEGEGEGGGEGGGGGNAAIRYDKLWYEADTLNDIQELYKKQYDNINIDNGYSSSNDDDNNNKRRRIHINDNERIYVPLININNKNKYYDDNNKIVNNNIPKLLLLNGIHVLILNGDNNNIIYNKDNIKELVISLGGIIINNIKYDNNIIKSITEGKEIEKEWNNNTTNNDTEEDNIIHLLVIAAALDLRVRNFVYANEDIDVINYRWLLSSIKYKELLYPIKHEYYVFKSRKTINYLNNNYDKYHDPYFIISTTPPKTTYPCSDDCNTSNIERYNDENDDAPPPPFSRTAGLSSIKDLLLSVGHYNK